MHYYVFFILKSVRIGLHFMVIVFKLRLGAVCMKSQDCFSERFGLVLGLVLGLGPYTFTWD